MKAAGKEAHDNLACCKDTSKHHRLDIGSPAREAQGGAAWPRYESGAGVSGVAELAAAPELVPMASAKNAGSLLLFAVDVAQLGYSRRLSASDGPSTSP